VLFNSYQFLFLFLPVTAGMFFILSRARQPTAAAAWLALASIFFYGYWSPRYVALLVGSIAFNFVVARAIVAAHAIEAAKRARILLAAGLIGDLGALCYFKYANFFVNSINAVGQTHIYLHQIVLPIGISFFTFTQIAFLVDAYRGEAREYRFMNYALFVTYFPHLIAGPVLHHKEIMPQFARPTQSAVKLDNLALGTTIFIIGLAKKVLIADFIADDANRMFAGDPTTLTLIDAWAGTLAYALQLYFDFSGYSDMAIGLSKMFGIDLPLNFNSPYKAQNIIAFWRRWHMTLSRFLRDYLYIPLGGNRRGPARRYLNIMLTMLLGGLWHGAGWGFVIWGGLHGVYLVINHGWLALRARLGLGAMRSRWWTRALAIGTTFLAVTVAWVFFRAESLSAALHIVRAMLGFNGAPLPEQWIAHAGRFGEWLSGWGIPAADLATFRGVRQVTVTAALLAAVWLLPNSQEITGYLVRFPAHNWIKLLAWRPSPTWAVIYSLMAGACFYMMSQPSRFLYFQF